MTVLVPYRHFLYMCRANSLSRERVKAQGRCESRPGEHGRCPLAGWRLGRLASSRFMRLGIPKPRFLSWDTCNVHLGCSPWPVGPGEQEDRREHGTRAASCATRNKAFCLWSRNLVFSAGRFYGQRAWPEQFPYSKVYFSFLSINGNFYIWLIVIWKAQKHNFSLYIHTHEIHYFLFYVFIYL